MTPLASVLFALVCAIFGTTSELADHDKPIADQLFEEATTRTYNRKLTHLHSKRGTNMRHYEISRQKREESDSQCEPFQYQPGKKILSHPKNDDPDKTYSNLTTCFTTIKAEEDSVIELTFVDIFELEGSMPKCEYDYLEIRDGKFGYATPMYKFCGKEFPPTITSLSPYLWLKFHSDATIEYAGFKIEIGFPIKQVRTISDYCYITAALINGAGKIGSNMEDVRKCRDSSPGSLDIQWKIETKPNTRIYLNITEFKLAAPNVCKKNIIQVFGSEPNLDHMLESFCGSVATLVTTLTETKEKGPTNIMYVRMFTADKSSNFTAEFTGFRTLGADEVCDKKTEFDCLDGTCINDGQQCDTQVNCRLKTDEDPELCEASTDSLINNSDTRNILIVLSLILTGICSVLIFKCAKKIYTDQKQIRENLAKSNDEQLEKLSTGAFMLDPGLLTRDPEPRASLERDNHDNEMVKQQRNRRKSTSSIESDLLDLNRDWSENRLIPTEEARDRQVEPLKIEVIKPKRDFSRKEESMRSNKSSKEEGWKKNRDVAVEAQGPLEAACQTRESLFQRDPQPSSDEANSSSKGRGSSTFGNSDGTVRRPSPDPVATEITIELMTKFPQETSQSQERRPLSSETTRSAPDVIIVAKPLF